MMKKRIFALLLSSLSLSADQQLALVLADDLNATRGILQRYDLKGLWTKTGEPVAVTLGRSGLGRSFGPSPLKNEGDGRSPMGVYPITALFGYDNNTSYKLPYWYADEHLICVDDVNDSRYNRILRVFDASSLPKSFETMRRSDDVYRYGAVVGYNLTGEPGRGSCIFIHANHSDKRPTSGCTAMDESDLKNFLLWLDSAKKPRLLQVTKKECKTYQKEFKGIECE